MGFIEVSFGKQDLFVCKPLWLYDDYNDDENHGGDDDDDDNDVDDHDDDKNNFPHIFHIINLF